MFGVVPTKLDNPPIDDEYATAKRNPTKKDRRSCESRFEDSHPFSIDSVLHHARQSGSSVVL